MIRIYSGGEKISYTSGDTFLLTAESCQGFEEDAHLRFQVAENEKSEMLIDSMFDLEEGVFNIELTSEQTEKLVFGNYVYRLVLLGADGSVVTRKSGELEVKWGA